MTARMIIAIAAAALGFVAATQAAGGSSWTIIDGQKDPLTEKSARYAVALTQSKPVLHGQPVTGALVIRCTTVFVNQSAEPELMLLFTGMTGLGRVKTALTRYRWDEGPIRGYTLKSAGVKGTRAIELPKLVSPTKLIEGEDPVADVVTAKRFRAEVRFASAATLFLDINVAGANDALRILACR